MKISVTVLSLFIMLILCGASWGDTCGELTTDVIKKHVDMDDFTVVSKRELNGLCELIINSENRFIPFYGNKKFLISGEMYENRAPLTENKLYELNKERFKAAVKDVEECVAFTYEPAELKTGVSLYMITDPLCPYCNKIGGEIKELSDRLGFRVKILLFTVHGDKGKEKCVEAVCRNMESSSFNLVKYNEPDWKKKDTDKKYLCTKGENIVTKTGIVSEKLGIESVPFFFVNDGSYVSGASIEEVEALFDAKK